MITLCVAKIGKNKFAITTTEMKDRLEEKYFYERQKANFEAQLGAMQDPFEQQQAAAIGAEAQIRTATHYETLRAQQAAPYAPLGGLFGSSFWGRSL